ncbi:MAG: hypothetical protein ACRESZ_02520 [Methylococcales bacterium]
MNMNLERLDNAVSASRNHIESWAIVLRFIAGFKSNADFDCFRDEFDDSSCVERRQSSGRDRGAPNPAPEKRAEGIVLTLTLSDSQAAGSGRVTPSRDTIHPIRIAS